MRITDYLDKSIILNREIDRLTYARDASIYRIIPEFAVRPKDENDIQKLFKYATDFKKSITFRASGTSLSGQTVTDGIIAEIAYDWKKIKIKNNGNSILLEPGVIGEHANQALKKYNKRIGPDPASIKAARIGGIIANNASGMTTGKPCNSYNTLKSVKFILPNCNVYDTSKFEDYLRFRKEERQLANGLSEIKNKIINNKVLKNKIIDKYRLKNTIGYFLNSFLDYHEPLDIIAHLLIGSEGTLAFVSNIELETVPDPPNKSACMVIFNSIKEACDSIEAIKLTGVAGLELMDYAALSTVRYIENAPYNVDSLPIGSAALLCEFQEFDGSMFDVLEKSLINTISKYNGKMLVNFERGEQERQKLWKIRKSLFTTIGSMRKPGTSVITEDICFDVKNLGDVITELHKLFKKWKYEDAVVFGHAKDGNLHFNLSIDLGSESGVSNYHKMMEEVIEMTVNKYNGSLKAEHGTGRNMAPYVEYEWGKELYEIMWDIKHFVDPNNILNRGVILNKNKNIHIENLKQMPAVDNTIDLCVECGFCEPVCPSRSFTFTPRNRITVGREINRLKSEGIKISKSLLKDYNFNTDTTCAVDGMCEIDCPININTGEFVKNLRKENVGNVSRYISNWVSNHFKLITLSIDFATKILSLKTKIFGKSIILNTFQILNNISSYRIPSWNTMINTAKTPKYNLYGEGKAYIYYPSCISRTFAADLDKNSLIEIMSDIAKQCNIKLIIPENIKETCCGTPFSSKGYEIAGLRMFEKTINLLYLSSKQGKIPIMVDTSPCTYKFIHPSDKISLTTKEKWGKLKFIDIIPFLNDITNTIDKQPLKRDIVLHPTCSTHKMEHVGIMKELALRCAKNVKIPQNTSCCGFAGDRGLIVPNLTKNAVDLNKSSLSVTERKYIGYSSSRMCEIGSSDNNQNYVSIALLVHDFIISK